MCLPAPFDKTHNREHPDVAKNRATHEKTLTRSAHTSYYETSERLLAGILLMLTNRGRFER